MSRLIIQENLKRRLAENTDFMLRLRFEKADDLPIKMDCIHLFIQYVALYQAMEFRLNQLINGDTLYLGLFNKEPWVDRSEHLKNDLREMKTSLSDPEKLSVIKDDMICPAVKQMMAKIAVADPVSLFAYFSVRCFSDAVNAQTFNTYMQRIFNNRFKGEFYNSVLNQTDPLSTFINQSVLTASEETQFVDAVEDFLQLHIELLDQMEEGRVLPEKITSQHSNYNSGCRYAMFALSAIGLAAAVGTAYSSFAAPK
ncbi:hypothetical protein [Legionella maioricensis]|uniref:Heme oxygenase n=1 Tax=Legionella maioricensis TaxID=2896528 RepID=A0A9X2D2V6_9GAMM|nr:hypothetical protein [Legionella maioricensis]MCL9685050.1 hypothetical protein [Legionella maioricensis]MCL9688189.1 hypothetical protein [Legionella maioricensis]